MKKKTLWKGLYSYFCFLSDYEGIAMAFLTYIYSHCLGNAK